jgi:hypothetical protein
VGGRSEEVTGDGGNGVGGGGVRGNGGGVVVSLGGSDGGIVSKLGFRFFGGKGGGGPTTGWR